MLAWWEEGEKEVSHAGKVQVLKYLQALRTIAVL